MLGSQMSTSSSSSIRSSARLLKRATASTAKESESDDATDSKHKTPSKKTTTTTTTITRKQRNRKDNKNKEEHEGNDPIALPPQKQSAPRPRASEAMARSKRRLSAVFGSDSDFDVSDPGNSDTSENSKEDEEEVAPRLEIVLGGNNESDLGQESTEKKVVAKKGARATKASVSKLKTVPAPAPKKKRVPTPKIVEIVDEDEDDDSNEPESMEEGDDSEESEFVHSSDESESESEEDEIDELVNDVAHQVNELAAVIQTGRGRGGRGRGGAVAARGAGATRGGRGGGRGGRAPNQFQQMFLGAVNGGGGGTNGNPEQTVEGETMNVDQEGEENVEGDDDVNGIDIEADGQEGEEGDEANPAPRRRQAAPRARKTPEQLRTAANEKLWSHHPELRTVWDDLAAIPKTEIPETCPQPEHVVIKLLPFQLEGVYWLQQQELNPLFKGGILADEMGMGKTIQIISLIVNSRNVKPNLILTPTVAILQWLSELKERVTPNLLKICVFHGTNRESSATKLEEYDVVLSTYSIVESLYRKQQSGFKRKGEMVKEKSVLHAVNWGRIVLDEAHSIKDRSSSTARAVFNLNTTYKWSVSGTPLQNRVGELYSLIRFLDADPFSNYFCRQCPCSMKTWNFSNRRHCDECGHISHMHFCWWNFEILKPIQTFGGVGEGLNAFTKLGCLLDRIMLRRTKIERADDLGLPPRVIVVRRDVFNQAEEELYASLYDNSKRQFSTYVASNTVLNNYASIFSLLSRMRLAVNHPLLVTTKLDMKANLANESLVCGLCQEVAEDAVVSKCKHVFCREDVREYMLGCPEGQQCNCPVCFKVLSIDLSQQEFEGKGKEKDAVKTSIVNYIDMSKWRSSTKIEALVEELTIMQREDATMKSIVFSQFVAFLDLIHWRLSRAGFNCVKLDGRMTPQAREAVISSFMTDPNVTIFLVSLKAGGVALNLTEASRVFILDPWWNPAVEDQAFDRIHRLGQHRPIRITRLIIENSIESRILQLQEKKKMLFQSTVGKDMDALAKLSEEDLAFLFVL